MLYCHHKIICEGFGGFGLAVFDPPAEGFHKRGADVIYPEIEGQGIGALVLKEVELTLDKGFEIALEIAQEKLVVLAGEKVENVVVVLLQMLEKVEDHRRGRIAFKNVGVMLVPVLGRIKNMAEKLLAELL